MAVGDSGSAVANGADTSASLHSGRVVVAHLRGQQDLRLLGRVGLAQERHQVRSFGAADRLAGGMLVVDVFGKGVLGLLRNRGDRVLRNGGRRHETLLELTN